MGRYRPVAGTSGFQPGHLLCGHEGPDSARSGHSFETKTLASNVVPARPQPVAEKVQHSQAAIELLYLANLFKCSYILF